MLWRSPRHCWNVWGQKLLWPLSSGNWSFFSQGDKTLLISHMQSTTFGGERVTNPLLEVKCCTGYMVAILPYWLKVGWAYLPKKKKQSIYAKSKVNQGKDLLLLTDISSPSLLGNGQIRLVSLWLSFRVKTSSKRTTKLRSDDKLIMKMVFHLPENPQWDSPHILCSTKNKNGFLQRDSVEPENLETIYALHPRIWSKTLKFTWDELI